MDSWSYWMGDMSYIDFAKKKVCRLLPNRKSIYMGAIGGSFTVLHFWKQVLSILQFSKCLFSILQHFSFVSWYFPFYSLKMPLLRGMASRTHLLLPTSTSSTPSTSSRLYSTNSRHSELSRIVLLHVLELLHLLDFLVAAGRETTGDDRLRVTVISLRVLGRQLLVYVM